MYVAQCILVAQNGNNSKQFPERSWSSGPRDTNSCLHFFFPSPWRSKPEHRVLLHLFQCKGYPMLTMLLQPQRLRASGVYSPHRPIRPLTFATISRVSTEQSLVLIPPSQPINGPCHARNNTSHPLRPRLHPPNPLHQNQPSPLRHPNTMGQPARLFYHPPSQAPRLEIYVSGS